MPLEGEPEPARDLALQDLDGVELELDDLAAAAADEVVVVLPADRGLVARRLGGDDRLLDDPGLRQERQRAIDRGLRAADAAPAQVLDEVLDGEVAVALEDGLGDGAPRRGEAEVARREEALERLHGLGPRGGAGGSGVEGPRGRRLIETKSHARRRYLHAANPSSERWNCERSR